MKQKKEPKYLGSTYTDQHIKILRQLVDSGITWDEVAEAFNKQFKLEKSADTLRKAYGAYKDFDLDTSEMIDNIRSAHKSKKVKAQVAKENRALLEYMDNLENTVEAVEGAIKGILKAEKAKKVKIPKPAKNKKRNMTMEIMLTDIHYGKKTKDVDLSVIRKRVKKLTTVALEEADRYDKLYNMERFIVFLGGDIIENADFHGKESQRSSEFGNNQQKQEAIQSLYLDVLKPLALTGKKIEVIAVTGNHDRPDEHKTFNDPGLENHTWVIYKALELLCSEMGYTNVSFDIPVGAYTHLDVYGSIVLYEHYDYIKGNSKQAFENHMAKRGRQLGKMVSYIRGGHYHEYTMFDRGRIIINASVVGSDSYSDINGYTTTACQCINYYIETDSRPDSFYHSFPVYLE
jgi:predicted MPP superfamily phosphohydrolase